MSRVVDYLAPMIYPSHWGSGQFGVASPINQPYEITNRSLAEFQRVSEGSGVRLVPWIQDFDLAGVHYGPEEVRPRSKPPATPASTASSCGTPSSPPPQRPPTP